MSCVTFWEFVRTCIHLYMLPSFSDVWLIPCSYVKAVLRDCMTASTCSNVSLNVISRDHIETYSNVSLNVISCDHIETYSNVSLNVISCDHIAMCH